MGPAAARRGVWIGLQIDGDPTARRALATPNNRHATRLRSSRAKRTPVRSARKARSTRALTTRSLDKFCGAGQCGRFAKNANRREAHACASDAHGLGNGGRAYHRVATASWRNRLPTPLIRTRSERSDPLGPRCSLTIR